MINQKPFSILAAAILSVLCFPTSSVAQNVTGTILGTLTDASGAAVTSATVVVVSQSTNIEYAAVVNDSGEFIANSLPPGTYTVRTQLSGFRPSVVKDVLLLANRSSRVNIVLEPGAVTQTVEVTATVPVINSENATVGNIMESG